MKSYFKIEFLVGKKIKGWVGIIRGLNTKFFYQFIYIIQSRFTKYYTIITYFSII